MTMEEKMIRRIDHISLAVRDLDRARDFFLGVLGGRELYCAPIPEQKFRWTTVELGSSCFIELIDPLEEEGFVYRFLENRGEGPHHVTIQVNDIEETRRVLQKNSIPSFGFAEPFPGWKEMYIHPKNAFGTLIQFAEFNPLDWIQPGYIPPSYREFAPPREIGAGKERITVRRVEGEEGAGLAIVQGEKNIRLPLSQVQDLIQALKDS